MHWIDFEFFGNLLLFFWWSYCWLRFGLYKRAQLTVEHQSWKNRNDGKKCKYYLLSILVSSLYTCKWLKEQGRRIRSYQKNYIHPGKNLIKSRIRQNKWKSPISTDFCGKNPNLIKWLRCVQSAYFQYQY